MSYSGDQPRRHAGEGSGRYRSRAGCDRRPLPAPGWPKPVFPNEPGDPLAGDADAVGLQFGMDARNPIALAAVLKDSPDLVNQVGLGAALRRSGLIAGLPVLEPTARHSQDSAQQADRIGGAVGGDEGELRFHAFSAHLAKKAEAFRRISFSSWSRLLSRRSCCNSAASTLRRATASADPAACCSRRQVFTCIAATPRALATLLSGSPGSSSRATAAALNSAVYRLRVFFVMTFLQMVFELNIWSGLAGQGQPGQWIPIACAVWRNVSAQDARLLEAIVAWELVER